MASSEKRGYFVPGHKDRPFNHLDTIDSLLASLHNNKPLLYLSERIFYQKLAFLVE
jgi:hypothetical protein